MRSTEGVKVVERSGKGQEKRIGSGLVGKERSMFSSNAERNGTERTANVEGASV